MERVRVKERKGGVSNRCRETQRGRGKERGEGEDEKNGKAEGEGCRVLHVLWASSTNPIKSCCNSFTTH